MLERFKTFLANLNPAAGDRKPGSDDPRVAAAALMILVADADGSHVEEERVQLRSALAEAFDLSGRQLDQLLTAGEKASREAIDYYQFTSVLNRTLEQPQKTELVRLLWETVYADGELHELEDNVVWRVAELIGVEQRERILLRRQARDAAGIRGEQD
ncbi:tellurite resistance TerB family protein [Aquamicrobium zhengzhouense]|uniref:TerB family tellurite resistance protein n=1 Tax=Aquamicrobium zhengzhouense TaxID=2781738 RepID=A0ABS0SFL5_9HYPH|nr:TerB family tellurite resistance protein [Aquamicrobium zhengzhouense]MBI1622093.1 TerB family tellurite resistance protein [Aquamicrobium zhengzhouense]